MRGDVRAAAARAGEVAIGEPAHATPGLSPWIAERIATADRFPFGACDRELALSVPAVRRGVAVIASAVASMPLRRWRDGVRIEPGRLLEQPEEWRPYAATINATVRDLVLYPYAWWYVTERDWSGYPSRVVRLDPALVAVEREWESGRVVAEWATYRGRQIPDGRLIRFDGPDEGLLVHGARTIFTALALEDQAARFASPEVPVGVLRNASMHDLTDAEIDAILDRWELHRRTRQTAYVNQGLTYETTQIDPVSLQLVEAREECALQLARTLGLPPHFVSTSYGDSMTYKTTAHERRELLDLSLRPYIAAIEERLSMPDRNGSPRGQRIRFDMDAFLRGNADERAALYAALIPLGVMTAGEARAAEELPMPPSSPEPALPNQDNAPPLPPTAPPPNPPAPPTATPDETRP